MTDVVRSPPMNAWTLAKFVSKDVFLEYLLQTQGSNRAGFLERLEQNQKEAKRAEIAIKATYMGLFSALAVVPLIGFFEIMRFTTNIFFEKGMLLVAGGLLSGFYFLLTLVYLLLFGVMNMSPLFRGETFRWLNTLPISTRTRRNTCFFSAFRSFSIPLVTMTVIPPILVLFFTPDIFSVLIATGAAFVNTVFSFCILVLFSERISRGIGDSGGSTGKGNTSRILLTIGSISAGTGISILMNVIFRVGEDIFKSLASIGATPAWNIFLSLIPYPFAPGYVITAAVINSADIPSYLLISTILGLALFIFITYGLYRRSMRVLANVVNPEPSKIPTSNILGQPVEEKHGLQIEIMTESPVRALRRNDMASLTRDMRALTFLLLPLMMPILSMIPTAISFGSSSTVVPETIVLSVALNVIIPMTIFGAGAMTAGMLNAETMSAALLAVLPIKTSDRAKVKLRLMVPLQIAGFMAPSILFITQTVFPLLFTIMIASLPLVITFLLFAFLVRIRLFGKLKFRYILEEAHLEHKISKWIFIYLLNICLYAAAIFPGFVITGGFGSFLFIMILLIIGGTGLCTCLFIFHHMFPK